jgi:quinoprotein glucose dehydrogenase
VGLVNDPKRSNMNYINGAGGEERILSVQGLPLAKTPWGKITAIDLNKGEIVWQIAHGDTPDYVRNHPALKGMNIPRTGRPQSAGSGGIGVLTTKTLVISGEGGIATLPSGQRGALLRAYDKRTGADAGQVFIPAPQTSIPMTYMLRGKQYLVIAVGGGNVTAELRAFALP